ncbi:MAG: hypothetical protein ACT4O2_14455 [Beijerinckiaceae bacterium]
MSEFKLPTAIPLFSQEKTTITSLWTVYVAATFAAAGYGFSGTLNCPTAIAVTVGFLAFASGHFVLLKQSVDLSLKIKGDVKNAIDADQEKQFKSSIKGLVDNANPPWVSLTAHLIIDLCVIVSIWSRVTGCAEFWSRASGFATRQIGN